MLKQTATGLAVRKKRHPSSLRRKMESDEWRQLAKSAVGHRLAYMPCINRLQVRAHVHHPKDELMHLNPSKIHRAAAAIRPVVYNPRVRPNVWSPTLRRSQTSMQGKEFSTSQSNLVLSNPYHVTNRHHVLTIPQVRRAQGLCLARVQIFSMAPEIRLISMHAWESLQIMPLFTPPHTLTYP